MEKLMPTSGSTKEKKSPTRLHINHADMPEIKDAVLGDEVSFGGKGHVISQRSSDEYGDGSTELEMHSMEHKGTNPKGVTHGKKGKKNAAHMPIDELKEVIKSAEPKES